LLLSVEKTTDKELTVVIDGKSEQQCNPAYTASVARDQAVLGYILPTLTRETLLHVPWCPTTAEAWKTLATLYVSQTRARSVNTRIALAMMKKNQMTVTDYYTKMSNFVDDLVASGAPLHDDEFVAYLLASHDEEYNPVFTTIVARTNPISPSELYAQLLSFEQHTALQMVSTPGGLSFAFTVSHGHGSSDGRGSHSSDRGSGCGMGRGLSSRGRFSRGGSNRASNASRPQCQVCLNIGHMANNCWHRFEEDYVPQPRTVAAASSFGIDNMWYMDFGATDHITGDMDCLTMYDLYAGADQVHAANETGMDITRIGKTVIPNPCHNLVLNNALHVPSTQKVLFQFIALIEFHPYSFLIKEQKTRKVLLHGPCKGGLFPLPPSSSKFRKLVFSAIKIPVD
jgi:hypothetical protein